jgi:hypothetical protein
MDPIGRLDVAALDCPNPHALARFYQAILGGEVLEHPSGGWVEVHTSEGKVAFQQIDDHRRPTWPDGDVPQQAHLDIDVDDLDAGETAVLALGAVKADHQPEPESFRVFLDPAGHPFCLVRPWPEDRPE